MNTAENFHQEYKNWLRAALLILLVDNDATISCLLWKNFLLTKECSKKVFYFNVGNVSKIRNKPGVFWNNLMTKQKIKPTHFFIQWLIPCMLIEAKKNKKKKDV